MGALTEREIFDRMATSFRKAAEHCDTLATSPVIGPAYAGLRDELDLIEGCCRQASSFREDCRWLPIGLRAAEAHTRAGTWLRGYRDPNTGMPRRLSNEQRKTLFISLANALRMSHKAAVSLRDKATGRIGMILPPNMTVPKATKTPLLVARNGLIVPQAAGHA